MHPAAAANTATAATTKLHRLLRYKQLPAAAAVSAVRGCGLSRHPARGVGSHVRRDPAAAGTCGAVPEGERVVYVVVVVVVVWRRGGGEGSRAQTQ